MGVGHYENFPVASLLLPARLRRPVALIYRFAREADDFADEGDAEPHVRLQQLERFAGELRRIECGEGVELEWFANLAGVIREFELPLQPFHDLLSAFAQDVVQARYTTHAEVLDYCRRSANPIGRLLLALFGSGARKHLVWSDAICTSLQLINFLQDVELDWQKNRVYLPQDEMKRFGVTETQIARHEAGGGWKELMAFQVTRARTLLLSGAPLGHALRGRIGLEMRMIVAGGARILDKIEAVHGDVFRHRPVLTALDWPLMLARSLP